MQLGKWITWTLVTAALAVGAYFALPWFRSKDPDVTYRTARVTRGDMLATIGATGSLEPEEAIDVGAQVAGKIIRFGEENGKPVDRCSYVKAGDLLAQIDPSLYKMDLEAAQAKLAQSKAQLAQSEADLSQSEAQLQESAASVVKAKADIQQMEAKETQAQQDWDRARALMQKSPNALAQTSYDGYKAAYLTAVANVASAKAAEQQAEAAETAAVAGKKHGLATIALSRAAIQENQAAVDRAERNLSYCTITSPVDGVILDRRVNIGQTVVASLNAPSLFLIAKDLTRMQILVSVNEADIGNIYVGQPVSFTVDARPGATVQGKVSKVRLDALVTQNVVTYPVEVLALNPKNQLLPYMTANVHFETGRRTNVLQVPDAALRYSPLAEEEVAPNSRSKVQRTRGAGAAGAPSQPADPKPAPQAPAHRDTGIVWTPEGPYVRPIVVRTGMTDGTTTEVSGKGLKEGLPVVVSEVRKSGARSGGQRSPFIPTLHHH